MVRSLLYMNLSTFITYIVRITLYIDFYRSAHTLYYYNENETDGGSYLPPLMQL